MPQTSIFDVWRTKGLQKKFQKPISRLKSDWFCLQGYYCLPNTKWFLCGFLMDHKSFGSEVSQFSLPLFSRELNMHLNYADRLPDNRGIIDIKGKKPVVVAEEFIALVEPYITEVIKRDSLEYFISRITETNAFRNTRIAYDYALALILNGQYEDAVLHLEKIASCDWSNRVVPEEADSASELVNMLQTAPQEAVNTVKKYYEVNTSNLSKYLSSQLSA